MTSGSITRLRETLAWVYARVPFYRARFDAAGVTPAAIDAQSLARVPVLRKTDLVASQRAHPPFGEMLAATREEFSSIHSSPGPIFIPRIAAERGGTPALIEEIAAMGVERGEVVHVTLSYHLMPGGLRLHRAFEEFGCLVINGGTGNTAMQVQVARAYGASVYAGTPSFLRQIGIVAREAGIDPRHDLRYRRGFSTAERLTPELRGELDEMFGIELFDHCGEAQIGPVAGECRAHRGMHLSSNDLFCEFVDIATGAPAEPGSVGELIATHLGPRALPLVRYAPGDAYLLVEGDCPCGNPSPRVEFFGQVGAIRKIKGVLVHPLAVSDFLARFPETGRFQLIVEHLPGESFDRATLRVGLHDPALIGTPAATQLTERISRAVKDALLISMDVALCSEAEVPETAAGPAFAQAIVDRRAH